MKKTTILVLFSMLAIGCQQQLSYKQVRDEVMNYHDEVMADHGKILKNQLRLDTLLRDLSSVALSRPGLDTVREKRTITEMRERLQKSEETMNDWMHQFEPDVTGKSNEEAVQYFKNEKAKIAAIDSLYKAEIRASDTYLSKFTKL